MAELGEGQRPDIMPSYPHMYYQDVRVWTKYLQDANTQIKRVWYDVHVGKPAEVTDSEDKTLLQISKALTRKRIDVVCLVSGGYWVVEVKPIANMAALGQIITYTDLFVAEYKPEGQAVPVIICEEYDIDVVDQAYRLGVTVVQV